MPCVLQGFFCVIYLIVHLFNSNQTVSFGTVTVSFETPTVSYDTLFGMSIFGHFLKTHSPAISYGVLGKFWHDFCTI